MCNLRPIPKVKGKDAKRFYNNINTSGKMSEEHKKFLEACKKKLEERS